MKIKTNKTINCLIIAGASLLLSVLVYLYSYFNFFKHIFLVWIFIPLFQVLSVILLRKFCLKKANITSYTYWALTFGVSFLSWLLLYSIFALFLKAGYYFLMVTTPTLIYMPVISIIYIISLTIHCFKKDVFKGVIMLGVMVSVIAIGTLFGFFYTKSHPTHFLYNDDYVIGSTGKEIIKKYGKPTHKNKNRYHYLVETFFDSEYYCIMFNEEGIAYKVKMHNGIC